MTILSPERVAEYWDRGYVNRIPVLTPAEVAHFRAEFDRIEAEQDEAHGGLWIDRHFTPWKQRSHPFEDWFIELAVHPRILDAVEAILGPDILVRNGDVFTKDVGGEEGVRWHVDSAMDGQDVNGILTAWIGLSPSTIENGCIQFAVATHRDPHTRGDIDSLALDHDEVKFVENRELAWNVMEPGELSLHHFHLAHRSLNNQTDVRRVGYVLRYMSPDITQETAQAGAAMLARGRDRTRKFSLKPNFPVTWDVDKDRKAAFLASAES